MEGRTMCIDYGIERREKDKDWNIYRESSGKSSGMLVPPIVIIATCH
jgi:hypothetical protein